MKASALRSTSHCRHIRSVVADHRIGLSSIRQASAECLYQMLQPNCTLRWSWPVFIRISPVSQQAFLSPNFITLINFSIFESTPLNDLSQIVKSSLFSPVFLSAFTDIHELFVWNYIRSQNMVTKKFTPSCPLIY